MQNTRGNSAKAEFDRYLVRANKRLAEIRKPAAPPPARDAEHPHAPAASRARIAKNTLDVADAPAEAERRNGRRA